MTQKSRCIKGRCTDTVRIVLDATWTYFSALLQGPNWANLAVKSSFKTKFTDLSLEINHLDSHNYFDKSRSERVYATEIKSFWIYGRLLQSTYPVPYIVRNVGRKYKCPERSTQIRYPDEKISSHQQGRTLFYLTI
jgi:hypothetical protein